MKHLGISLVDAYLIVRSRRLSVLIQPNMRLLYNLCGWEIKLAKERAQGDEQKLKRALARTLNWPYLAKEVVHHSLFALLYYSWLYARSQIHPPDYPIPLPTHCSLDHHIVDYVFQVAYTSPMHLNMFLLMFCRR